MQSTYDDNFLPSLLNFDLRDLELNRKGLFARHQLDQLRKLSSSGCIVYAGILWLNIPFLCMLPLLLIAPSPDTRSGFTHFIEDELTILAFMLFISIVIRLASRANFRKIHSHGPDSVMGYLKPVVKKHLYRRTYVLQIGDQDFTITEPILMKLIPFIQKTGPVYYRAYYSRLQPELLLSLEHFPDFPER